MGLFEDLTSEKDQSTIEEVGTQITQPMALVFSIEERNNLKKAMNKFYGTNVKMSNYSDFFLELINKYVEE